MKRYMIEPKISLAFLQNCIDKNNGFLPNTGANDGSLFLDFVTVNIEISDHS